MHFLERKLQELYNYFPALEPPGDLDDFWERTLEEAGDKPADSRREPYAWLSPHVEAYRVVYRGYDETPIHGWYLLPSFGEAREEGQGLPCVVLFHGYSGSKGEPDQYAAWLLAGFAVFAVDVRGQNGETGNRLPQTYGMTKGWVAQGVLDPYRSYYRAISVDAVQALRWAAEQPEIDRRRIAAAGTSQGGGLALIAGALSGVPCRIVADIPNMCHMDYGLFASTGSLSEIADFVSRHPEEHERVLRTLGYFDMLNLCGRLRCPVMMSAGLKDTVCPPETIFAVYNRLTVPKEMHVFPFNGHAVSGDHFRKRVEFIRGPEPHSQA